jgi:hypothetical protein
MVKRSGPLGLCFLEVARPPRQPGSSLRWGCDGGVSCLWPPHMSNAKQQDISLSEIGQSELCARVQACTRVHTHTHTHTHTHKRMRWKEEAVQKSLPVSAVRATARL